MPVVAIVALVASGVITFIWSQQRRLIYFPSAGPVPSASSVLPAGRDVVVETQDGMRLGGWYFPHTSGGSPYLQLCDEMRALPVPREVLEDWLWRNATRVLRLDT